MGFLQQLIVCHSLYPYQYGCLLQTPFPPDLQQLGYSACEPQQGYAPQEQVKRLQLSGDLALVSKNTKARDEIRHHQGKEGLGEKLAYGAQTGDVEQYAAARGVEHPHEIDKIDQEL
ncbi:hypothetical protein FGO68_gene16699 [Halteria grandinella]|uniref:Uncharacterized protein n=1 Tax=Halteria grandinella TaxID=5974 RepID=A0A8J8SZK3_HALGN|nr:hypothetical protein FGO68_gene16699 [Halteria grandinella]